MPLTLPDRLPAIDLLKKENIFVMDTTRATTQDIRPLKIVILNLMPIKITTETDLVRLLSNSPLQLEISFMKIKSHTSKNTPVEHMRAFYKDFEVLRQHKFDGMIITGAPVEHLAFEEVTYWDEMVDIFAWARTHVTSTLYICWAAQAGLYYHYGVPKYPLPEKMFGIFPQRPLIPQLPIFRGFDDVFYMPHSRHTEIRRADIEAVNQHLSAPASPAPGASSTSTVPGISPSSPAPSGSPSSTVPGASPTSPAPDASSTSPAPSASPASTVPGASSASTVPGGFAAGIPPLTIIAESEESGVSIVMAREGREFFITGHAEYSPLTLDSEYRRDLGKGLPIQKPRHYYKADDPNQGPLVTWRAHANLLFTNWLNYYVYQETPYDIEQIH